MKLRARSRSFLPWAPMACAAGIAFGGASGRALAADPPVTAEARSHFTAGVNLLRDPDGARYEEAYREFKAAYAASPSYKILGNLGLCAMKLERDGEAIEAYTKYLEHANDLDPAEAKQVTTDLQTLKTGLFKLTLVLDAPGATLNDVRIPVRGDRMVNQYGPLKTSSTIGVRAGHHQMTVRLAGSEDVTWEFEAAAGASETKQIRPRKANQAGVTTSGDASAGADKGPSRPVPAGVYIGLAAAGALAAGGAITGLMALGKKNDFDAKNDGTNAAAAQELSDSGKTLNLVTDLLFGGAVISAGIAGVLYFSRPPATVGFTSVPTIALGNGGATLGLLGSFQ